MQNSIKKTGGDKIFRLWRSSDLIRSEALYLGHTECSFLSKPTSHSFSFFLCVPTKHPAAGQISPRGRRTSTSPRSPVRPSSPALLRLLLLSSTLWLRPLPLISAGPPVVPLLDQSSRSQLTGLGPTPALDRA